MPNSFSANTALSEKAMPDKPRAIPDVFFVVGPTCSGKTDVAQWIAERYNHDILSADSMSVYRKLDIGTAKPGITARNRVRYWGIDLVEAQEPFSAGKFRKEALAALVAVAADGRNMIVAGGTGLYIKILIDGFSSSAPANAKIRKRAEQMLKKEGIEALANWLKQENKILYESLSDKQNPRRLVRALERARAGYEQKPSGWNREKIGPIIPCLAYPPKQMERRIENRARRMFASGLIKETEYLLEHGLDTAPTARHAIGYAEAIDYIRGKCSMEEAIKKTIVRTRQLVKKQNTWFRHQANIETLHCDESMLTAGIAEMVMKHWQITGPTPIKHS